MKVIKQFLLCIVLGSGTAAIRLDYITHIPYNSSWYILRHGHWFSWGASLVWSKQKEFFNNEWMIRNFPSEKPSHCELPQNAAILCSYIRSYSFFMCTRFRVYELMILKFPIGGKKRDGALSQRASAFKSITSLLANAHAPILLEASFDLHALKNGKNWANMANTYAYWFFRILW